MPQSYDLQIPAFWNPIANPSATSFALNETTDRVEVVFKLTRPDTLTRVWTNVASISGAPVVRYSLQGVNSSGRADGTIKASGNASVQWSPSAVASWQTLTSSYAASRGEELAVVAELISGTSANINIRIGSTAVGQLPYVQTFDNATATLTKSTAWPIWGVGSASTCYGFPIRTPLQTTFTSAGTNEYGNVFTLPAWASTFRVSGAWIMARINASASFDVRLYSGSGASATTVTLSAASVGAELFAVNNAYWLTFIPFEDASLTTFNSGDSFRLSVLANNANSVGLQGYDLDSINDSDALNPWNRSCFSTSRAGGNWTDLNTRIYGIWPGLDDMSVSAGSAGVMFRRCMNGGMV